MENEFGFGVKSDSFDTLLKFKEDVEKQGWKLAEGFGSFNKSESLAHPDLWFDRCWNDGEGNLTDLGFHLSNASSAGFYIDTPEDYQQALEHCAEVIDSWDPMSDPETVKMLGMDKLYYVVELGVEEDYTTGWKSVSVYRMVDNKPTLIQQMELEVGNVTEDALAEEYPYSEFIKL